MLDGEHVSSLSVPCQLEECFITLCTLTIITYLRCHAKAKLLTLARGTKTESPRVDIDQLNTTASTMTTSTMARMNSRQQALFLAAF
jgi:hypothetical protein